MVLKVGDCCAPLEGTVEIVRTYLPQVGNQVCDLDSITEFGLKRVGKSLTAFLKKSLSLSLSFRIGTNRKRIRSTRFEAPLGEHNGKRKQLGGTHSTQRVQSISSGRRSDRLSS